jgi:hypothetical protein
MGEHTVGVAEEPRAKDHVGPAVDEHQFAADALGQRCGLDPRQSLGGGIPLVVDGNDDAELHGLRPGIRRPIVMTKFGNAWQESMRIK